MANDEADQAKQLPDRPRDRKDTNGCVCLESPQPSNSKRSTSGTDVNKPPLGNTAAASDGSQSCSRPSNASRHPDASDDAKSPPSAFSNLSDLTATSPTLPLLGGERLGMSPRKPSESPRRQIKEFTPAVSDHSEKGLLQSSVWGGLMRISRRAESRSASPSSFSQGESAVTYDTSPHQIQVINRPENLGGLRNGQSSGSADRAKFVEPDTKVPLSYLVRAQQEVQQLQKHLEELALHNSKQSALLRQHEATIARTDSTQASSSRGLATASRKTAAHTGDAQVGTVEEQRNSLQRTVSLLEEALRMRNAELKALLVRTTELESNLVVHSGPAGRSKCEERLLSATGTGPRWEEDIAGQWITALVQTLQAVESILEDSSRTLSLRLQGEASQSRQIRVLNGRILELEKHHRLREQEMGRVLQHYEFLGKAHVHILENDVQKARKSVRLSESTYTALQNVEHLPSQDAGVQRHSSPLVAAMQACAAQARAPGSEGGLLAVLDQASRALASAWVAIQERDAQVQCLEAMAQRSSLPNHRCVPLCHVDMCSGSVPRQSLFFFVCSFFALKTIPLHPYSNRLRTYAYMVATISRLLKIIRLFYRISSLL